MPYTYWEYFLSIEEDLLKTARYVEFHQDNYSVYSIEFALILLASCSEIDTIAKLLYSPSPSQIRNGKDWRNIADHKKGIYEDQYHKFPTQKINIPRYELTLSPWSEWAEGNNRPSWWESYNAVKHRRNEAYNEATLENTLNSVAGLLCIVLYYYLCIEKVNPPSSTNLLFPKYYVEGVIPGGFSMSWEGHIPDPHRGVIM